MTAVILGKFSCGEGRSGGDLFTNSSIQPQYLSYLHSKYNQETSVKEVVGMRSTARCPVVEDEAVLHLFEHGVRYNIRFTFLIYGWSIF